MFHYVRVALAAAVAVAAVAGVAEAQNGPGPRLNGPQNGPQANGPRLNGPQANGPRLNGPQIGPQANGQRFNGPQNGPQANGPQFNYRFPPQFPFRDFQNQNRNRLQGPQNNGPAQTTARGWLGVEIQPVDNNLADALKLPAANGALVSSVTANSPAATAGIKSGDVIVSINGRPTNTTRDLTAVIGRDQPNTKVTVGVWRNAAKQDIAVTLGTAPGSNQAQNAPAPNNPAAAAPAPAPAATTGAASLGLTLGAASGGGISVTSVSQNSAAAKAGVRSGDQVVSVGSAIVATTADVDKAVDAARQSGAKNLLLLIKSGQNTRFVAVSIG